MSENWKHWQGQTVGDGFQLMEYLGGSDNTAVYLASAPDDARVAIKLVACDPATADAHLARWRIAESLSHPHLLKVLRSGRCELGGSDLLFVVMEYAEENLSQILPQRSLTADEVREMLPPMLDALDYLHSSGLVHGRVTPGNIMAAGDQLKLSADTLMRNGESSSAMGAYSAPEVQLGVSSASDIWSLGVTLTEVMTQHLPVWEPGGTLPQLPDNLPEQFRVIVQHCLLRDAGLRSKTADIRERLKPPATRAVQTPAAAQKPPAAAPAPIVWSAKRFVIPVAIAAVVIGVVVAIPHLSERPAEAEKPTGVPTPTPGPQPQAAVRTSPPPKLMSEASDSQPAPQKQKSEPIRVLIPEKPEEKPSAAKRQPNVEVAAVTKLEPSRTALATAQDGIVNRVLPDIPRKAMNTINGKFLVQVKVRVDRGGNVVGSEFVSPGPSRYFANLTMQAAREWKFSPSETANRAWDLQFEFRRSGITSVPTQVDR